MKFWIASLGCFLPLAAQGLIPPLLRIHLPWICAVAWAAAASILLLPRHLGFLRLVAALVLAQAWLGLLKLPWRHAWDGQSYWIALGTFPLFAAGLRHFLGQFMVAETAAKAVLTVVVVYLFPIKSAFRVLGLDLPPTFILSPLALAGLVVLTLGAWPRLPAAWKDLLR